MEEINQVFRRELYPFDQLRIQERLSVLFGKSLEAIVKHALRETVFDKNACHAETGDFMDVPHLIIEKQHSIVLHFRCRAKGFEVLQLG